MSFCSPRGTDSHNVSYVNCLESHNPRKMVSFAANQTKSETVPISFWPPAVMSGHGTLRASRAATGVRGRTGASEHRADVLDEASKQPRVSKLIATRQFWDVESGTVFGIQEPSTFGRPTHPEPPVPETPLSGTTLMSHFRTDLGGTPLPPPRTPARIRSHPADRDSSSGATGSLASSAGATPRLSVYFYTNLPGPQSWLGAPHARIRVKTYGKGRLSPPFRGSYRRFLRRCG